MNFQSVRASASVSWRRSLTARRRSRRGPSRGERPCRARPRRATSRARFRTVCRTFRLCRPRDVHHHLRRDRHSRPRRSLRAAPAGVGRYTPSTRATALARGLNHTGAVPTAPVIRHAHHTRHSASAFTPRFCSSCLAALSPDRVVAGAVRCPFCARRRRRSRRDHGAERRTPSARGGGWCGTSGASAPLTRGRRRPRPVQIGRASSSTAHRVRRQSISTMTSVTHDHHC